MYKPLWSYDLQNASWRGIPFYVSNVKTITGRRNAIHEYPYRDLPWVEDLGRGLQEVSFDAFLIGDDVAQKFQTLKRTCEMVAGPGELVHPRLGALTASLISSAFVESREASNMVAFSLSFLVTQKESSTSLYPIERRSSLKSVTGAALDGKDAADGSFLQRAGDAIRSGQAAVRSVVTEARGYVAEVQTVVSDATRAVNVVAGVGRQLGIPGLDFSRYLSPLNSVTRGLTAINTGLSTVTRVDNTTTSLIASAGRARDGVVEAGTRVIDRVSRL